MSNQPTAPNPETNESPSNGSNLSNASRSPYEMPDYSELGYKRLLRSLHKMVKDYRVQAKKFAEIEQPWANGKAKDCIHTVKQLKRILKDHKKAGVYFDTFKENCEKI